MGGRKQTRRRPDPEALRRFVRGAPSEMSPDALTADQLPLREIAAPPEAKQIAFQYGGGYVRSYMLGECSVIVTREFGRWHLSVAHPKRYPTWIEISAAWYRVIPNAAKLCGALILPPLESYVNDHEFCMQVVEIDRTKHD